MNQLNQKLRAIQVQLALEEKRPEPNTKRIQQLKKEEAQLLEEIG